MYRMARVIILSLIISAPAYANEYYSAYAQAGTIHTVQVIDSWCGNLSISTKVGYLQGGQCQYVKETTPYAYDGCIQYLNGGLLEDKVGLGYTCAATTIQSNFNGESALDEYHLLSDANGHYIGSEPSYSEVLLSK